jgi:hypothetical protein
LSGWSALGAGPLPGLQKLAPIEKITATSIRPTSKNIFVEIIHFLLNPNG